MSTHHTRVSIGGNSGHPQPPHHERRRAFPSFVSSGPIPRIDSGSALDDVDRSAVFAAASRALTYPDQDFADIIAGIDEVTADLPPAAALPLQRFTAWAKSVGQQEVEQTYVATFDQRRRCALELTYFATGDTRQRGFALSVFADLYKAVGFEPTTNELPDFLPTVLELAARTTGDDCDLVLEVITAHREGIEILHAALTALDSPFAPVVEALRVALPAVDEETRHRMAMLIRQGPPTELVGAQSSLLPWPTQVQPARQPQPAQT